MYERILPIGSIVLNKGASRKVMIVGYYQYLQGDETKIYDYIGVGYPEGFVRPEYMALFDHDQIERIYSLGFQDEIRLDFEPKLIAALKKSDQENNRNQDN